MAMSAVTVMRTLSALYSGMRRKAQARNPYSR
jgi:hypothetical protein